MTTPSLVGPTEWPVGVDLPQSRTIPDLVDEVALATPDAPALVAGKARWTYSQLAERVNSAAKALAGFGVGAGTPVALLAPNTSTWLEVAFGAMRRGARVDAFNTWVRTWDLQHLLRASAAEVLLIAPQAASADLLSELRPLVPQLWEHDPGSWHSPDYPALRHVVVLGENVPPGAEAWQAILDRTTTESKDFGEVEARGDHAAVVLYTSGSTRHPKAVPLQHGHLIENGFAIGERMGLTGDDRVWLGSPLFWSFGIANAAMATMTHRACLVLQERFSAAPAARLMASEECTAAYLLPSIVDALAVEAGEQMRSIEALRTGLTIGRPDELRRVVEELDIPGICNVYGSTETYGNCCVTPHWLPVEERTVTQGEPLPGVALRVVDPATGEIVPRETAGELQVRGRIMSGYLGEAEANTQAMTTDGWFRTGDTGMVRPDGRLQFLARHSEMIKTSGINVSPLEVESFISTHPDVHEVAVVGAPHPTRGEVVVAFVSTTSSTLDDGQIVDFCKGSIAGYKVPHAVVVVSDLPRTGTGKLARKSLVSRAREMVIEEGARNDA